ncbi:MAG: hypothetical protein Q4G66_06220 [bacterium]|nr:hypothetical protein [bacterium]
MENTAATGHCRFRKRIGEKGCELILQVTVQEKAVTFPTDARLFSNSRERLVRFAGTHGVRLRQNYNRLGRVPSCGLAGIFTPARRNGRSVRSNG